MSYIRQSDADSTELNEKFHPSIIQKWTLKRVLKVVIALLFLGGVLHILNISRGAKDEVIVDDTSNSNLDPEIEAVHHFYPYESDTFKPPQEKITKTIVADHKTKYKKTTYTNNRAQLTGDDATVLFMASIAREDSYGPEKTIKLFIDNFNSLNYDQSLMSIGLLCASSQAEKDAIAYFDALMKNLILFNYARVTIVSEDFMGEAFARHADADNIQRSRRRMIARARNFALLNCLQDERYVVFVDADVWRFDNKDMLQIFVDLGHDIIVPRIDKLTHATDYDKNTWRGRRIVPLEEQLELMNSGKYDEAGFVPNDTSDTWHILDEVERIKTLPEDAPEHSIDYAYEVDSVGGCVLFAKSVIYKQGVIFPPLFIIGTDQERVEGYDGIETEGVCYVAKLLDYKCWAMPNIVAQHVV